MSAEPIDVKALTDTIISACKASILEVETNFKKEIEVMRAELKLLATKTPTKEPTGKGMVGNLESKSQGPTIVTSDHLTLAGIPGYVKELLAAGLKNERVTKEDEKAGAMS